MIAPYNPKQQADVVYSDGRKLTVSASRCAQTIDALFRAKNRGINAAELSSWALKLNCYIYKLRHKYGFIIETQRVDFVGGWYAQYVLKTPLESVNLFIPDKPKKSKPPTGATVATSYPKSTKDANLGSGLDE